MRKVNALVKNVAANSLTMGLMLLFQLLSVPIFLRFWGVELYGEWLALNTLTAYFQMTDVGLNTATGNSFTFNYVKKNYEKCNILISNNVFFIITAFIFIFLIIIGLSQINFFTKLFRFKLITPHIANLCLLLLFLQVMVGTFNNLLNTFYTATSNYARGIMIDNSIRFSEYTVLIIGVIIRLPVQYVLLFGVIVKIIGLVIKYIDSNRFYKIDIRIKYIRKRELREIFLPAVSFFSFPVANSLSFQGVTLIVNFFLGSAAVVLFNTTRTLVNFSKSTIDILHKSVWPELSIAYGKMDLTLLRKIHYKTLAFSIILALSTAFLLVMGGGYLYTIWTKGKVILDPILFNLLIVALITNTIWSSSNVILQSTNNHKAFSFIYLLAAVAIFIATFAIVSTLKSVSFIPISMLMIDFLLMGYVIRRALIISEDTLWSLRKGFFNEIINLGKSISNFAKYK